MTTWKRGSLALALALFACGGEGAGENATTAGTSNSGASAQGGSAGGGGEGTAGSAPGSGGSGGLVGAAGAAANGLTYWQDLVPIFEENCFMCHQSGGIGPNFLTTYVTTEAAAAAIADAVETRSMPPWDALSDGSCGDFSGVMTLSDEEIATIVAWKESERLEGTPGDITLPAIPGLAAGSDYSTPEFVPMPEGGLLAMNDEYRCFLLESGVDAPQFITGYQVDPGVDLLIHHVIGMLVDPAAPSSEAGLSNAQQMQALDDESPDRLGWPCFGMAGDGVEVHAVPVTWAPGQGVVSYPGSSGVPINPSDRLVVQVHYNMENQALIGQSDITTIRLQLVDSVERIGVFELHDPLLASLALGNPDTLMPGQASVPYTWQASLSDFGLGGVAGVELHGVMPHMHKLGHTYNMRTVDGANEQCAVQVNQWDIHWQRMYFYQSPLAVTDTTEFHVTCDFDTTEAVLPVIPGWGTSNEMCLAVLYFTIPSP